MSERAPSPGRFLKLKDVMRETSFHHATIYRRIAAGEFPRPRPIGGGRVAWLEREIEEWKIRTLEASPP
jgi:prophage regulatory protein